MSDDPEKVAEYVELAAPARRLVQICARVQNCYRTGRTVAVYVPDPQEAGEIDDKLWTFRQEAFIPHLRLEDAAEPLIEPVILFSARPEAASSDVLVVATAGELPGRFEEFPHIYDFAPTYDEQLRKAARKRFSACREAGYRMRFIRS